MWITSLLRDNFFLQLQRICKIYSPEPARLNRKDMLLRAPDARQRVPSEMVELNIHICAAPGIPNRADSCARKWVSAIASASAESGSGVSVNPSNARIMNATWSFFAAPVPTVACLIRLGAYSKTGKPLSAAARIAAPRAAPSKIAVL